MGKVDDLSETIERSDPVDNTRRIAKNTMMLYIRMLFSMLVSLYTTRIVLDTLGIDDYGINNVVGGVVGLMGVVTGLLSQGTSRFITIALGKQNREELCNTFSASVTIHIFLAGIILVLGEILGPLVVSKLNISPERMGAAQFVFQLSLFSSILSITQSPFHAAIMAHEKMSVYAYISIWDVLAKLGIVYLLQTIDIDKLKLYSLLFFIVCVITALTYLVYCRKHFEECRAVVIKADKRLYKEIFNYTGWNAIGSVAYTMNSQGITILLSAFGASVNAARGIAGSVSGVVYKFVDGFQTAAKPQIVKLYAIHEYAKMNNLVMSVSKFSSYLIGFIGIPLFLEMEFMLQLWLKDVPEYTVIFARLTLVQGFIQAIDLPVGMGIHAVGKMKLPNLTSAFIYMLILPISYMGIKFGASPEITYVLVVCVYPLALFMDVYILHKYTSFHIREFLVKILLKSVFIVGLVAIVVYYSVCNNFEAGFLRLVLTTIASSILFIALVLIVALSKEERTFIKINYIQKLKCTILR